MADSGLFHAVCPDNYTDQQMTHCPFDNDHSIQAHLALVSEALLACIPSGKELRFVSPEGHDGMFLQWRCFPCSMLGLECSNLIDWSIC